MFVLCWDQARLCAQDHVRSIGERRYFVKCKYRCYYSTFRNKGSPMNAELLDLKAFVTVAELGSFVRTAEALNLSQPALSRRIQKLEESLGAPLLERSTRHVKLTMVGRELLPKVRRFLDELEASVLGISDLGSRSAGLVSIAAVPTAVFYFLPQAIARFSKKYPRIRIRILDIGA